MGIFDSLEKALSNLKEGYFVAELPFNELYPEEEMLLPSYQLLEGKIYKVSYDGHILELIKDLDV